MTPLITSADIGNYSFSQYRKTGTTSLSDQILPTGTRVATLEGEYVCQEPSRLAIDAAGNVYPVAESIRLASYERTEEPTPMNNDRYTTERDRREDEAEHATARLADQRAWDRIDAEDLQARTGCTMNEAFRVIRERKGAR